jgi:hypothetical protein
MGYKAVNLYIIIKMSAPTKMDKHKGREDEGRGGGLSKIQKIRGDKKTENTDLNFPPD